ncbi:uncharacterized protein LOC129598273 [Paramacrobiotus metropolitanus]|uniref:uncharacterized protein LOC129598273 n=1 Tax=Paramacrobiotus metropolitanus TaxID=2943436 RepID=UPI002446567E|nr:uncharacterized protein LOC129598273 [Paramacrobiotus metropolitanus]
MASVLFKRLSSSTKHVAVMEQQCQTKRMPIMEVFDIFTYLTAQRNLGIKLTCIHLFGLQCRLHSSLCVCQRLSERERKFTSTIFACRNLPCENIRLIECIITMKQVSTEYHSLGGSSLGSGPVSVIPSTDSASLAIWAVCCGTPWKRSCHCRQSTNTDLTRLANWLSPLHARGRLSSRRKNCSVLVCRLQGVVCDADGGSASMAALTRKEVLC